jgi:DNA-binding GntR family transcriptional regulator
MASIDPNDPRAPYQQIADDLRAGIRSGTYQAGQRMPSNRELAASYGVAAMTVYQAVRVLRDEGLVTSYQGRGVFVGTQDPVITSDAPAGLEAIAKKISRLESRVTSASEELREEVVQMRRQLGEFRAQLIELYARTGHQYPRDQADQDEPRARPRRAAGA